jgi:hypothetical protein
MSNPSGAVVANDGEEVEVRDTRCDTKLTIEQIRNDILPLEQEEEHRHHPPGTDDDGTTTATAPPSVLALRKKIQRLYRLASNPNLVECPHCDLLMAMPEAEVRTLRLQCAGCRGILSARDGTDVLAEDRPVDASTLRALQRYTKPCPHCGVRIQKSTGCSHVVCTACGRDFCWKCGTAEFLTGRAHIRTCSRCRVSYRDHRVRVARWRLLLWLPLWLPLCCAWLAVVGAAAAGTGCCFGCFLCGECWDLTERDAAMRERDPRQFRRRARVRGIKATLLFLLLPVLLYLEDVGCYHFQFDDIFPDHNQEDEIPGLETKPTGSTSNGSDGGDEAV